MTEKKKIDIEQGPFGLRAGGLFLISMIAWVPVSMVLEWTGTIGPGFNGDLNTGPAYIMVGIALLIEFVHSRWKRWKIDNGQ